MKQFDIETENIENNLLENEINSSLSNLNKSNLISNKSKDFFTVSNYDENCEEHFKINSIVPIKINNCKLAFLIFLNMLTLGIINLFIVWFPSLKLKLIYSQTNLEKANYVFINCKDNENYIINLNKKHLPKIKNSFLKSEFNSNVNENEICIFFVFKLFTYIFDSNKNCFVSLINEIDSNYNNIHKKCSVGLNSDEYNYQKILFGICDLEIKVNSFVTLLAIEFTDPFYIFQVFSIILWYTNDYAVYSTIILVTTLFSLFYGTYETRSNLLNLQQMAKYSCNVNVKRKNSNNESYFTLINSRNLVPGDLFEVQTEGLAMPCDCILLNGSVIINEAMLTGESTPIIKNQIQKIESHFNLEEEKKNFLFAGTKVIQKRTNQVNEKVLALVYKTGFNTSKGNLIRSIIYPKNIDIKFKQDSIKYIYLMGCLSIIGFSISIPFLKNAGQSTSEIIKKCLDLITTAVPPSLPACLGIGISYAVNRLKSQNIICINRDRVNLLGKINTIVFDKTGTLTEDHLDIHGFRPIKVKSNEFVFDSFLKDPKKNSLNAFNYYKEKKTSNKKNLNNDLNQLFIECLASCHSATLVNNNLIGDPIDVKMFQASDWNLFENEDKKKQNFTFLRPKNEISLENKLKSIENEEEIINSHYEISIVRRFDFSSKLQRMSVITKNSNEDYYKLFCKGSPEKIKELCKSDTIPKDFNDVLKKYTSKGFRVLALSFKMMKMNFIQSQEILREKCENNLIFLGLLIVQNKLKEKTKPSLELLHSTGMRMLMATGDNILTAISVSREAKLISSDSKIMTCELTKENKLIWNLIENFDDFEIDCDETINQLINSKSNINFSVRNSNFSIQQSFSNKFPPEKFSVLISNQNNNEIENNNNLIKEENENNIEIQSNPFSNNENLDIIIAIEGSTFEKLLKLKNKYSLFHSQELKIFHTIFKNILKFGFIFARMSPEHKAMLVESLKEEKLTVCMCGDGANDCSALRTAHVGVSLSPEEASIAAPFTSNIPDISCLIIILKEGKAALVTSLQTFKYMMMYSLVQFICVTLLNINYSYLSDWQFLAVDVFIIIPLAFFIPYTKAYPKLTKHKPTDSLISFPIICSILIQTAIAFVFQFGGQILINNVKWKINVEKCVLTDDGNPESCALNTVIFLISNMQYLITAFVFTISKPFKKPFYTNVYLTLFLFFSFAYSVYITIGPFEKFSEEKLILFDLNEIYDKLKLIVLILILVNFFVAYLCEKLIVPCFTKIWNKYQLKKLILKGNLINYEYNLEQIHIINQNNK